ncbi:META domain-containing protein [Flavobacterium selenitireducens]|uniref:META domain-containing protein n=1 Tax=Flavobacterium selenitireducens TaxID=2722704 RepID=UPI00168AFAF7|nr:META domain-containing protein [Flavobacterium selenitireducens]MBD3582627.1 META domain-containing protein [Flavobacterium selenitireducens]
MKRLLLSVCTLGLVSGCGPKKEKDPEPAPTEIGDTSIVEAAHTAENSLDYLGRYKGKIDGKETSIELSEDFSYLMTATLVSGKKAEVKGIFKWNPKGDAIVLDAGKEQEKQFFVGERFLVLLDADGKRLNAKNTGDYVLAKQSESDAAKSDGTPMDRLPQTITGIHWRLSEINGRTFRASDKKEYFIQLNQDGSFGAFAGCNRMGGKYELNGSKVRMFNIISTMMACPEMKIEEEFKKALETCDNYVANEKVLQFRKGGANLVKFDAFDLPKP